MRILTDKDVLAYVIIRRYFLSECSKVLLAVISVLLVIALSNRFVLLMAKVARGELSPDLMWQVLGFYTPELLAFLLPLSLFLSILLVLGRWYVDQELSAAQACGMGWRVLLWPIFGVALFVTSVVAALTLWGIPHMNYQRELAFSKGEIALFLDTVSAGQFHRLDNGRWIFYVEKMDNNRQNFEDIFIAERINDALGSPWRVLTAKRGKLQEQEEGGYFVLEDGVRYDGSPGEKGYTEIHFKEYARHLEWDNREVPQYHRLTPTRDLWGHSALGYQAELQWRLAIPITTLVLAFLAVPLAKVKPRSGKYARILPAILIYIAYYNLLTLSKRWISAGVLTPQLGLFWVHGAFAFIALFLWKSRS